MTRKRNSRHYYISGISTAMAKRIAQNEFEIYLHVDVNEKQNRYDLFLKTAFSEMSDNEKNQLEKKIKYFESKWKVFHIELLDIIKLK